MGSAEAPANRGTAARLVFTASIAARADSLSPRCMPPTTMSIVFISYSHDSAEHRERVLGLSERLRKDGIDTRLDQYVAGTPPEMWPRWMLDRLEEADFVLVVCTKTYFRRFRGHEEPGKGKGVDWEGAMIIQEIYDARSRTRKFVPVLFAPEEERHIPEPLRGHTFYTLTSEASYRALRDFLLDQAGVEPGPLGPRGMALAAGSQRVEPSRLRHGAARLFGREEELAALDEAWDAPGTHVLSIV
ncbi:MAG TPA: SEFIR domain-containing protein, partial [Thermoanaerobaculia bacterium]